MKLQSTIIDTVIKLTDTPRKRQIMTFVTILFVAVVVTIGPLVGYLYFINNDTEPAQRSELQETDLGGTLFMTLVSGNATGTSMVPTAVDVATGLVYEVPVTQLNGSDAQTLQFHLSENSDYTTFLGTTRLTSTSSLATYNVHRSDTSDLTSQNLIGLLQAAEQVTDADEADALKMRPVISNSGTILYAALSEDQTTNTNNVHSLPAEAWKIYTVNEFNVKSQVARGLHPTWIGDRYFAFLKNDGAYLYDTETNTEKLVWPSNTEMTLLNGFDVSFDGRHFVVTDPQTAQTVIVEMVDRENRQFGPGTVLDTVATNPVFSPDGTRIAMIVPENEETAQIRYYSLVTQQFEGSSVPLDMANLSGIYLTDWQ